MMGSFQVSAGVDRVEPFLLVKLEPTRTGVLQQKAFKLDSGGGGGGQ